MEDATDDDASQRALTPSEEPTGGGSWSPPEHEHSVPIEGRPRPRSRYAWALAFSPLVVVGAGVIVVSAGLDVPDSLLTGFGIGIAVALGMYDSADLRAAGVRMPQFLAAFLAAFLGVIYLILRAVRVRGGYVLPLVWCVALAAPIAALVVFDSSALSPRFDARGVEQAVGTSFRSELGPDADVSCPDELEEVGDRILCTVAADDGGRAQQVEVTLVDEGGGIDMVLLR